MPRYFRWVIAAGAGTAAALILNVAPASATVSATPATWTPKVTSANATVRQLVQCGSTMYAVGSFSQVSQGTTSYTRHNAFSFSATSGAMTSWNPNPNAEVNSVALSSTCRTAYLGGVFSKVGATAVKNLAAVDTGTGALATGFAHNTNGSVKTIVVVNGGNEVLVGGTFTSINGSSRKYYASLNKVTGAVDSYLTFSVAGVLPPNAGGTMVYNQQVSPRGDRLLFEGDFTTIGAAPNNQRLQLAELNLGATSATVNPWHNDTLNNTHCSTDEQFYGRAAAFSPDQNTIYLATTGFKGSSPFCDAVTAFSNTSTGSATVKWMNKTGGDSLYAVAAGPSDVYIGGHERWANNPKGSDSCGAGCVSRPGIADIGATSGLATSWNPGRARGHGADDLLITPAGLWVASDTFFNSTGCGGAYHPGICFFPGTA